MKRLPISNIDALREDAAIALLARTVARSVMPNASFRFDDTRDPACVPKAGWSVLRDAQGNGIALHVGEIVPSGTLLSGIVARLESARALSRFLDSSEPRGFVMVEDEVLSDQWRLSAVHSRHKTLWFGVLGEWQSLSTQEGQSRDDTRVRISLVGQIDQRHDLRSGDELECCSLRLEFVGRGLSGKIVSVRGGKMSVRVDEESQQEFSNAPGIKLELGELEMKLDDLLALQPGHVIEVEVPRPIQAYLKIGHSQLALGHLEIRETGFAIKVAEVL
jgi:hypothetical protein